MKRALDLIKNNLQKTNIVLEILDARAPFSSKNPLTEKIIKNQTKIILLHKSDIAQITEIIKWKNILKILAIL